MNFKNINNPIHRLSCSFFCALTAVCFLTIFNGCHQEPHFVKQVYTDPADFEAYSATLHGHTEPENAETHGNNGFLLSDKYENMEEDADPATNLARLDIQDYKLSMDVHTLKPNTEYFYRAVATGMNGRIYGEIKSFTTTGPAGVKTLSANYYSSSPPYCEISGSISDQHIIYGYGIMINTKPNPEEDTQSPYLEIMESHQGKFTFRFFGLQPQTKYYAKAYVFFEGQFGFETDWGNEISFTTP